MKKRTLNVSKLQKFALYLKEEEKSAATMEKYVRDVRFFSAFIGQEKIDKEKVLAYKRKLGENYAVASANSMIAALNSFFRFCGWHDLCVKQFKIQRQMYCSEEKELTRAEYIRLLKASNTRGNERLSLIIQTICSTGIRVSELQYITVEAIQKGEAFVHCKGKNRRIFIVSGLKKKLLCYAKLQNIRKGMIFVTKSGKAISRSNVWKEMKSLCKDADVAQSKVFPHNLRHLFARTFYSMEKDIAKLADILGHTSINTTRIYIITTGAEHKRKMEHMHLIL